MSARWMPTCSRYWLSGCNFTVTGSKRVSAISASAVDGIPTWRSSALCVTATGSENLRTQPAKCIQGLNDFQFASRERPQLPVATTGDGIAFGAIDNPVDAREVCLWQTSGFRLGQLALRNAYFCLGFVDVGARGEGAFQTLFERQALTWGGRRGLHGPHEEQADAQSRQY